MDWPVTYARKVRYSDVDSQAIVFNANYAVYFDDVITDLFEKAGVPPSVTHAQGYDIVTAHLEIDFRSSARLGETVITGARIERIGNRSIRFALESWIEASGVTVAEGVVVFVVVDPDDLRPMTVPESFVDAMQTLHSTPLRSD